MLMTSSLFSISLILFSISLLALAFQWRSYPRLNNQKFGKMKSCATKLSGTSSTFDASSNEEIKSFGNLWGTDVPNQKINLDVVLGKYTQNYSTELLFKPYPFQQYGLPYLKDSMKYQSGKYGELIWHQDMDQVILFFPIDENIPPYDVSVTYDTQHVTIKIANEIILSFLCYDRITENTLWNFEYDMKNYQKKYLQITLEKRLRYINWKSLFGGIIELKEIDTPETRMKLLEKLFQANQGLAKIGGENARAATIDEMMEDENLMNRIYEKVDTKPYPMTDDEVKSEKLTLKMLNRLMREKRKSEQRTVGEGEKITVEDDDDEDDDAAEGDKSEVESLDEDAYNSAEEEDDNYEDEIDHDDVENSDEIKERTDEDLGEYDEVEID